MKKIFSVILVVCMILTLPVLSVFADVLETPYDITTSDVMTDLNRTYIDGVMFDEAKYPLNIEAEYMLLLNIVEYAWADYGSSDPSPYGLYFYLYNPSGDKPLDPGMNQVQMSVAKDDFYVKYFLELVSASEDYRFLKFRITTPTTVYKRLWSVTRTYKISGIEIETKAAGVKEYKIAGTYTFTGKQSDRTLECKTDTLLTIELDLGSTFYRLNNSPAGKYYQSQLDSVYFALDNWIMEKYGEVYSIQFEYTKRFFNTLVSWDDGMTKLGAAVAYGEYDKNSPYTLGAVATRGGLYNPYVGWHWDGFFGGVPTVDFVMAGFHTDSSDTGIPAEDLLAFAYTNGMFEKADQYAASHSLFTPAYFSDTIYIGESFDLLSYEKNHKWYEQLVEYGLFYGLFGDFDEQIEAIQAIQKVTSDDAALSDEDLSSALYIDTSDVKDFKAYFGNASDADQSVYLFRFGTQDYYSMPMYFFDTSKITELPVYEAPILGSGGIIGGALDGYEGMLLAAQNGYYSEQYLYQNFDVMSITFRDQENRLTILPVISDPTDILGDVTPPPDLGIELPDAPDFKNVIAIVGGILVILLIVWLISKIFPKRVRVVDGSGRRRRRR